MAVVPEFLEHLRDLFADLGPLSVRRMFSGAALYVGQDMMIAMISASGTIYMKSDETT